MAERRTMAELDRLGRVTYAAARAGIACEPYDALPDWRRRRWREAALAAIAEAAAMDVEKLAAWKTERRQAIRISRDS